VPSWLKVMSWLSEPSDSGTYCSGKSWTLRGDSGVEMSKMVIFGDADVVEPGPTGVRTSRSELLLYM
jgi:hypothetical protein